MLPSPSESQTLTLPYPPNSPDLELVEKLRLLKWLMRQDSWARIARHEQLPPPGEWRTWLFMAGRGAGKTRAGAEWVLAQVRQGRKRGALIAPTAADARDVMVEGASGLLAVANDAERPVYEASKRRLTWPNGATATLFSADEPERLRGPQNEFIWADEIGAWRYAEAAWDMAMFGLRLGADPRACVTTTPRPTALVKRLLRHPATVVTRSTTYANRANLAPQFFTDIITQYEGTRLGRQELQGELLEDTPGALWTLSNLDEFRLVNAPQLKRVVVAVDPAATSGEESNETGIVVAGLSQDKHGYTLADASLRGTPMEWANAVVTAFDTWQADRVIVETNQGGEMVAATLRTVRPNLPIREVRASRGKQTRAEPVAALYEQGRVHHVGVFKFLEDQLTTWVPGADSPDRLDALVWAYTELLLDRGGVQSVPSIWS